MKIFCLGIFVMPRANQITKNGSQTQAFFFVFHKFFDTVRSRNNLGQLSITYNWPQSTAGITDNWLYETMERNNNYEY